MKTKRECETCHKGFKPMADAQWGFVYNVLHIPVSVRHQKYLALAR